MNEELKPNPAAPAGAQNSIQNENIRLRGDLLTIARRITHDLRTPLGGIITTGEVMKEILKAEQPSAVPLMASIFDSADSIDKLLERVSFVLKASANPPSLQRLKMEEAVFRARQRLEYKTLQKGFTVSEPKDWPEVNGVAAWLEVVWWNFLINGLNHGKSRIELGWRMENGEIQFWVFDDGDGVPEKKRPKLFQPFHLMHEHDAGRGLGLSIVQRLVELQGGRCGYGPRPDGAWCFYFTLPA